MRRVAALVVAITTLLAVMVAAPVRAEPHALLAGLGLGGIALAAPDHEPHRLKVSLRPVPVVRASPTVLLKIGQIVKDCDICPELVVIPAGSFMMGSPESEPERGFSQGPVHRVTIDRQIAVGRYELSRGEFARFVKESGHRTEAGKSDGCDVWTGEEWAIQADKNWRNPGFEQTDDHPVVCVSWNDAQAYLSWLNSKVPGKGFRLLSEAEWEYAARAGKDGNRFPWGDDLDYSQMCRHANGADGAAKVRVPGASNWMLAKCNDGYAYTAPGSALPPNEFGLYHMHGNAFEWVQDVYHENYSGAPTDGNAWESGGDPSRRVMRGGSWNSYPWSLRSAYRNGITPDDRFDGTGFRLARIY